MNKSITKTDQSTQADPVSRCHTKPRQSVSSKRELKFLGHVLGENGIKADLNKLSAIVEMEAPTNIPEGRRFMGMANQLGKFSKNLANLTRPLRQLLSKHSTWLWGPEQDQAFTKIKTELTKPTVLALYDPQAPTKVSADAS